MSEPVYDPENRVEIFAGFVGDNFSFPSDLPAANHAHFVVCNLKNPDQHYHKIVNEMKFTDIPVLVDQWLIKNRLLESVIIVAPSEATTWRRLEHLSQTVTSYKPQVYPKGYIDLFDAFYGPGLAARTTEREGATLTFMCDAVGLRAPKSFESVPPALHNLWGVLRP